MGRPHSDKTNRVRKVDARFTEEEYQVILALEKQLGIRKTDLVRTRLLQNAPTVLLNAKEMIALLDAVGTELGRAGNNINQMARYANTLQKNEMLVSHVVEQFNRLLAHYVQTQKNLEVMLRKIIRQIG